VSILRFYQQLFTDGDVVITERDAPSPAAVAELTGWLLAFARFEYHPHLPPGLPTPDPDAVHWSARQFYRACQFQVFRELGPELLHTELASPSRLSHSPAAVLGVDLCFRFLPDLLRIVRGSAPADPLIPILETWARAWPLSSVGIPLQPPLVATHWEFLQSVPLQTLYLERIIRTRATDRLLLHPELLPRLLTEPNTDWAQPLQERVAAGTGHFSIDSTS
jgi:hypothetical protein